MIKLEIDLALPFTVIL